MTTRIPVNNKRYCVCVRWIVIKVIRVCVRVCGHTRNDNVFCTTNCKKHSIKITVYGMV